MAIWLCANYALGARSTYDLATSTIDAQGPNILHIYDVPRQSDIDLLLERFPSTDYVVSDHVVADWGSYDCHGREFVGLPAWLCDIVDNKIKFAVEPLDALTTNACANFICNKKQINRFLCIKLAEWFGLNCNYTWSGNWASFDMSDILNELNNQVDQQPFAQDCLNFLLAPIGIEPRFVAADPSASRPADSADRFLVREASAGPWTDGLNQVFLTSAVSLITESVRFEHMAMFTEKTVYSVLGCTFPIWVGGYNQAQQWQQLGFDIFDDIIDHSYQNYPTLIERCYYAFKNNLDILTNIELAVELRTKHQQRLIQNRELMLDNQLERALFDKVNSLPVELVGPATTLAQRLIKKSNSKNI